MRIDNLTEELERMALKYCRLLECDGTSNVLSYYLKMIGIKHECFIGSVYFLDQKVYPHFWIETQDLIIDFKTRIWLGDDAPQGVMFKDDVKASNLSYAKDKVITLTGGKMLIDLQEKQFREAQEREEFNSNLNVNRI